MAHWHLEKAVSFALSYLRGKVLAALYIFVLLQDLQLMFLTWAPSVPRQFSSLNVT